MGLLIQYSSSLLVVVTVAVVLYLALLDQGILLPKHLKSKNVRLLARTFLAVTAVQAAILFSGFVMHLQKYGQVNFFDFKKIWVFGDRSGSYFYERVASMAGELLGSRTVAGMLLAVVSVTISAFFIYKLVMLDFTEDAAGRTIKFFLIFPFSFCLFLPVQDSVFIALAAAAFFCIRSSRWLLAGILMFAAILTDLRGICLILPFILELLLDKDTRIVDTCSVLFAPAGLVLLYLNDGQAVNRMFRSFSFIGFRVLADSSLQNQALPVLFVAAAMLVGCIYMLGTLRASYLIYVIALTLLPVFTVWTESRPGVLTAAFPMFIGLGLVSQSRTLNLILSYTMSLLAGFFLFNFINLHIVY